MAHIYNQDTSAFLSTIDGADLFYSADITALNSSGVKGDALFVFAFDGDGGGTLHSLVTVSGSTPDETHLQHIHGTFGDDGTPSNATTPTILDDADNDGYVEVLEGLPKYGDILLPLNDADGNAPMSDSEGNISFYAQYDIEDLTNFVSPVTDTQYSYEDIADLALREYVIHGLTVPAGAGDADDGDDSDDGEVNGSGGYIPILPAGASEITQITQEEASDLYLAQVDDAGVSYVLDGLDNVLLAGAGMDTVNAGRGDDTIDGGDGGDDLFGYAGDDMLIGGEGSDLLNGGSGDDMLDGGSGRDAILGGLGNDTADGGNDDDWVYGFGGMDVLMGGSGADIVIGGNGDDDVRGGTGDDLVIGSAGDDRVFGEDGDDFLGGGAGDDLLVGGDGIDALFGGAGADILGGLGGDDRLNGGAGADEFHFDAGTGSDIIRDFTRGEDVISLLDGGAISFANSTEDDVRGDSDLDAADFDTIALLSQLDLANDQQVVASSGGVADAMTGTGAAVEAYVSATDGTNSYVYYDSDWSDTAGRELVTQIDNLATTMILTDFDVY